MADQITTKMARVKIGTEEFSLAKVPSSKSALVAEQKKYLLGSINLPILVEDLGRVGKFVRIAYNGVAGYTELQIQIREIGYDVTRLCDKSAITVSSFKQASGNILEELKATYAFLLDGMEGIALVTLSSVSEVAKGMASAAEQLHKDFEEESRKVEAALRDTMREKGKETERKKEMEENNRRYAAEKTRAEQAYINCQQEYEESEQRYRLAEEKQDKAHASATSSMKAVVNAVTAPVGIKVFNMEADEQMAKESRDEKLKHLEEVNKQMELRRKAIRDIAEFAKKIKDCSDDAELATVAIDALHQAMGGLQKLSVVMLNVATFWKQLQVHCEILGKDTMERIVQSMQRQPQKQRLSVWTSSAFVQKAVNYYAHWVALDDVCGVFMEKIMKTQGSLHGYLTENPTVEQARARVHQLAETFGEDLKKTEEDLDKRQEDYQRMKSRVLMGRADSMCTEV